MGDPRTAPYGSVRLADVDTLAQVDPGNPNINDGAFHLVRRHFDIQAFGVNAATGNAGDEMLEEHHEADDEENETNGHQELFAVMTGHALFTVDGEEIDAPWGTIVFLDDVNQQRAAIAKEAGTTVLAIGGRPGAHPVSSWEYIFPSLPARNAGDWGTARTILEEALAEQDIPAIRYHLACVEAHAGNADRALDLLRSACDARPDYAALAAAEDDLASIRDDPRFPRSEKGDA
jgi:hypothetical protein